jgi:hypothetical protein
MILNAVRGTEEKVEIVDAAGNVAWTGRRGREQNVVITLPAGYLAAGAYSVRIGAATYPFTVR